MKVINTEYDFESDYYYEEKCSLLNEIFQIEEEYDDIIYLDCEGKLKNKNITILPKN